YARGFLLTGDPLMWKMARSIAADYNLGDLGAAPGENVQVNLGTDCYSAVALFSVLDLYEKTKNAAYLDLGRAIGDNIVAHYYHHGYFTPYEDTIYANINAIEPYALLALDAAIKGSTGYQVSPEDVPYFLNGFGFYAGFYRFGQGQTREVSEDFLFRARKSDPNPRPTSSQ